MEFLISHLKNMDANSESEDQYFNVPMKKVNVSSASRQEGHNNKPKRQMKTPFQLETLEKAYAVETYPSEATRTKLSKKLDLTDRQLQMWFCHRRLKDRKEDKKDVATTKKCHKAQALLNKSPLLESPIDQELNPEDNNSEPVGSDYESQCGSGFSSYTDTKSVANLDEYLPMPKRYHQSSSSLLSSRSLQAISYVEARLDGPLREDGPILGFEFDPLPPDAFGVSLAMPDQYERNPNGRFRRHEGKLRKVSTRSFREHQVIRDQNITSRANGYGQVTQPSYNDSPIDSMRGRRTFKYHGDSNQHFPRVSTATKSPLSVSYMSPPQSKGSNYLLSSPDIDDHDYLQPPESPFMNNKRIKKSTCNPVVKQETNYMFHDEDDMRRLRKKHKVNHRPFELDNSLKA